VLEFFLAFSQIELLQSKEPDVAKINISSLDIEALLALREQVDARLREHQHSLHQQLSRLGFDGGRRGVKPGSSLSGRKVPPKYRSKKDPKLTWAGRGAVPTWMRQEMKAGKLKKEAFLIR
jgi:DNA-binding protein H-NS